MGCLLITSWVALIGIGLLVARFGTVLPRTFRVSLPLVVAIVGFIGLNVVNLCGGFCDMYGFPLPYHYVSDAVVVINGVPLEENESPVLAGIVNTAVLLLASWLVWKIASRLTSSKPSGP